MGLNSTRKRLDPPLTCQCWSTNGNKIYFMTSKVFQIRKHTNFEKKSLKNMHFGFQN